MAVVVGASSGWTIGLVLGVVVVLVAAAIVITIVVAGHPDRQAGAHGGRGRRAGARSRPTRSDGVGRINDSGVRILHSARALRKVAVGK